MPSVVKVVNTTYNSSSGSALVEIFNASDVYVGQRLLVLTNLSAATGTNRYGIEVDLLFAYNTYPTSLEYYSAKAFRETDGIGSLPYAGVHYSSVDIIDIAQEHINENIRLYARAKNETGSNSTVTNLSVDAVVLDITDLVEGTDYWVYGEHAADSGNSAVGSDIDFVPPTDGQYHAIVKGSVTHTNSTNKHNTAMVFVMAGVVTERTEAFEMEAATESLVACRISEFTGSAGVSTPFRALASNQDGFDDALSSPASSMSPSGTYPLQRSSYHLTVIAKAGTLFSTLFSSEGSPSTSTAEILKGTATLTAGNPVLIHGFASCSTLSSGSENYAKSRISNPSTSWTHTPSAGYCIGNTAGDTTYSGGVTAVTPPDTGTYNVYLQVKSDSGNYLSGVYVYEIAAGVQSTVLEIESETSDTASMVATAEIITVHVSEAESVTTATVEAEASVVADVYIRTEASSVATSMSEFEPDLQVFLNLIESESNTSSIVTAEPTLKTLDPNIPRYRHYPSVRLDGYSNAAHRMYLNVPFVYVDVPLDGYKPNTTYMLRLGIVVLDDPVYDGSNPRLVSSHKVTIGDTADGYDDTPDQILYTSELPAAADGATGSLFTYMGYPRVPTSGSTSFYQQGQSSTLFFTTGSVVAGKSLRSWARIEDVVKNPSDVFYYTRVAGAIICDIIETGGGTEGVDYGVLDLGGSLSAPYTKGGGREKVYEVDLVSEGIIAEGEGVFGFINMNADCLMLGDETNYSVYTLINTAVVYSAYVSDSVPLSYDGYRYIDSVPAGSVRASWATYTGTTLGIYGEANVTLPMVMGTQDAVNRPAKLKITSELNFGSNTITDPVILAEFTNHTPRANFLWFKKGVWKHVSGAYCPQLQAGVFLPTVAVGAKADVLTWSKGSTTSSGYVYATNGTKELQDYKVTPIGDTLDLLAADQGDTVTYARTGTTSSNNLLPVITMVLEPLFTNTESMSATYSTTHAEAIAYKTVKYTESSSYTASTVVSDGVAATRELLSDVIATTATTTATAVVLRNLNSSSGNASSTKAYAELVSYLPSFGKMPMGWFNSLLADIIPDTSAYAYYTRFYDPLMYNTEYAESGRVTIELDRNYYNNLPVAVLTRHYELQLSSNVMRRSVNYQSKMYRPTESSTFKRHYIIEVGQAATNQLDITRHYSVFRPEFEDEILALINAERSRVGASHLVQKFTGYGETRNIAHEHAVNMHVYDAYGHEDSAYREGYRLLSERGALLVPEYSSTALSENSAASNTSGVALLNGTVTAQEFYEGWRLSAGHYANMIYDWREELDDDDLEVEMLLGLETVTADHVNDVYHGQYISFNPDTNLVTYAVTNFIVSNRSIAVLTQTHYQRHYELQGVTSITLDRNYSVETYNHVSATLDIAYGEALSRTLDVPYSSKVSKSLVVPIHWGVERSFTASYWGTVSLSRNLEANYALLYGYTVAKTLDVPYSERITRNLNVEYGDVLQVTKSIDIYTDQSTYVAKDLTVAYELAPYIRKDLAVAYSSSPYVAKDLAVAYESLPYIRKDLAVAYELAPYVRKNLAVAYELAPYIRKDLAVAYSSSPYVAKDLAVAYSSSPHISKDLAVSYGEVAVVRKALVAVYDVYQSVAKSLEVDAPYYSVCSADLLVSYQNTYPVSRSIDSVYTLLENNPVNKNITSKYAILSGEAVVTIGSPSVVVGGKAYTVDVVEMGISEEDNYWTGDLTIKSAELFSKLRKGTRLTLNFYGLTYNLIVDSRSTSRTSIAELSNKVSVSTVASVYDGTESATVSYLNSSSRLAHDLAEELLGTSIQWDIVDWSIPAYRLSVEGATPIEAASVIVEAVGGLLLSNPQGEFRAVYKHKVSYNDYQTYTPDVEVSDLYDVLSQAESYDFAEVSNKFRITESLSVFSDIVEYEADEGSDGVTLNSGKLKVYPSPWRTSVQVRTTSGANVLLSLNSIVEREEEEVLEIVRGEATTAYPIDSVVSIEWLSEPLGGIAYDDYATNLTTSTTVNEGYGLIKLVYNTKAIVYDTTLPIDTEVQFIVEDIG